MHRKYSPYLLSTFSFERRLEDTRYVVKITFDKLDARGLSSECFDRCGFGIACECEDGEGVLKGRIEDGVYEAFTLSTSCAEYEEGLGRGHCYVLVGGGWKIEL